MTVEEALDQLLCETKSKYDRQVVAALFHVAENRADWITWRDPDPSFPSGQNI
jgi:HD-GYP domain-containing protein (c-di-GMP phosphodiesterase class II)